MVYALSFVPVAKIVDYYLRSSFRGLRTRPVRRLVRTVIVWMTRTLRMTPAGNTGRSSWMFSSLTVS